MGGSTMRLFQKLTRTHIIIIIAGLLFLIAGILLLVLLPKGTKAAAYSEDFGEGVKQLYELGLVDENNVGFTSEGQLTNADAVMLAARTHAKLNGKKVHASFGEWYEAYYKYAKKNGFPAEEYGEPDAPVTRGNFADMLARATAGKLNAVNAVESIPDVPAEKSYAQSVLALYVTGITLGEDSYGNFFPAAPIARIESAEFISRVFGDEKITGTLDKLGAQDGYSIVLNTSWNATKEGLASGWELDNRGGLPRNSLEGGYGKLNDISEEAGTQLIRRFNCIDSGVVNLVSNVNVDGRDGAYLEFRNSDGVSVWRCEVIDGAWQLVSGGVNTKLVDASTTSFDFRVSIDLENNRTTTAINGKDYGTYALAVKPESADLAAFVYGTTEKGKCTLSPTSITVSANYPLNEDFTYLIGGKPYGNWTLANSEVASGALKLNEQGSAAVSFNPVCGKIIAEFMILYKKADSLKYSLRSGERDIAVFTTSGEGFSVNGELVFACDYDNLWYRIRMELDTVTETMLVKVNGRDIKTVGFASSTTSVDGISILNTGANAVLADNMKVFREYEREDYVPEPVVPKDSNNYTVGMNVCSLWRNGSHYGWSCISPYDDVEPVLGYYDEGVPETADWEIKYIVEHGIDFQAFCVYMYGSAGALRPGAEHLYNGFMNAKYSDMTKFCVIWECANAESPTSVDEWKNSYVPYFIENYFKDPRHITIDNKLVMCVFGTSQLSERIGGAGNVRKGFDYLEEEVKKLGYDGMIYLACGNSSDTLSAMGFDGCYAYNWGTGGSNPDVNISSILSSAKQGAVYTVPTVSVGFNSIPWHGERYPMMTAEDYATVHEWVKTEYLPKYAKKPWQENLVMLSTWNEYGEGTYIMPTADEKGFSYLDVLREAYTDEKADPSLNTIPTLAQKARITNLYPQDLHLLRRNGSYKEEINTDSLETVYTVDYSKNLSVYTEGIKNIKVDANGISGTTSSTDPMIIYSKPEPILLDDIDYIIITAKYEKGAVMQMFFTTEADKAWNETKSKVFPASVGDDGLATYIIRTDTLSKFTGKLAGIRIDTGSVSGAEFTVKSVEFLKELTGEQYSMQINIDGNEIGQKLRPTDNGAGDTVIAFDPAIGLDFALNCFHRWNKEKGELTLSFKEHVVVYTVGKDTYLLDGNEKPLGYKLATLDKLPLIPIEKLCNDVGYSYKQENGVIYIETDLLDYYNEIKSNTVKGQWDFNTDGNSEGWSSNHMLLSTSDGYMSCESATDNRDPVISYTSELSLDTTRYTKLEMKVRYKHDGGSQSVCIYFATDLDGNFNEAKTIKSALSGTDSGDEWEIITIDLTEISTWQGNCIKLRFDPFNAIGHMDIDYIRFLEG